MQMPGRRRLLLTLLGLLGLSWPRCLLLRLLLLLCLLW
jgi:hypothetical protein